jgi:hypothetical protein
LPVLRARALELMSLLERRNEDAITRENKRRLTLHNCVKKIVLSSDIVLVATT